MKILILADQCNPEWASLPSFSYALAKSIADNVDITLVTQIRNKSGIEKAGYKFKEVIYIDNEYIAGPLHKFSIILEKLGVGGLMTNMAFKYPANIAFEYETFKKLKVRIQAKEFTFIQRISPVSPTVPSPISKWADIPFIYGPINGGLAWPEQFKDETKNEREFLRYVRNFYRYLPYYKSTFSMSTKILAAFSSVENDIPYKDRNKIMRFNELGVDTEQYKPNSNKTFEEKDQCKFVFVGRLVPCKCTYAAILAFANSQILRSKHKFSIVGDGPERESLQKLIDKHNLNDSVEILGWMEQSQVAKYMAKSDVFVFPSIREAGGNVILEAMSSGLPSIVANYGGPGELVDDKVGIKLPLTDKQTFLDSCVKSMELLADNTKLREKLSLNARERAVDVHDWVQKGRAMKKIYSDLL